MTHEVPEGWEVTQLGDCLAKMVGGGTPSRDNPEYWNGNIPWATVKDLKGTILDHTEETITEKGLSNSSANIVPNDTIIIATRMAVGKAVRFTQDVSINQDLRAVFPREKLDKLFLHHWLTSKESELLSVATGTTVKGIRQEVLKAITLNLPPLPEQKKIAEVLSSVDEAIAATKAVIDQTKQVKKGLLQTLLTRGIGHTKFKQTELGEIPESWEVVCLEEIALVERGKFSARPRNDPKYYGGDIPFIQTGDVVSSNGILRKHRQTLNEHGLGVSKRFAAHVVLVTIAANIGDTAITTYPVCCPDSIVAVQPNEGIDVFWLQHILASKKSYLDSVATQNAQKNINLTHLKPLLVALPPFEERENIASILNGLRNTEVDNVETLEQLQTLKRGLMSDLLTGRKRVEVLDA